MGDYIKEKIRLNRTRRAITPEIVKVNTNFEDELYSFKTTDITNPTGDFNTLQPLVVQLNKGQNDLKKIVRAKTNFIFKSYNQLRELFGSGVNRPDVYTLFIRQNAISSKIIHGLKTRLDAYSKTLKPINTRLKDIAYEAKKNINSDEGLEKRVRPLLDSRNSISTELNELTFSNPDYYDKIIALSEVDTELSKEKFGKYEQNIKQVHFDKRIWQLYINKGIFEELLGKTSKMMVKVTQYQQIIAENLPILKMTSDLAEQVRRIDGVVNILSDYASEFTQNYTYSVTQLNKMTSSNKSLDQINLTLDNTKQLANELSESERREVGLSERREVGLYQLPR